MLSALLLGTQHLPGFDEHIESVRTRELSGAVYELFVAYQFAIAGYDVRFRKPSGVTGGDYDLDVIVDGINVAVEVKSRDQLEESAFKPGLVSSTLKAARGQLPPSGPSIVFVQIPWTWGSTPEIRSVIATEANERIRSTSRINRIVVSFEEVILGEGQEGGGVVFRQAVIDNPTPRSPVDLERVLRGVSMGNAPATLSWDEDGNPVIGTRSNA